MSNAQPRAAWFKSSYSRPNSDCVEAAHLPAGQVGVRDSKNPTGPALTFDGSAWDGFLAHVRAGEYDR